jgi:hypothetical protein
MQPCNRIYYSTIHWRLKMFWAAYHSSSGALTVFAASGLHTHVVPGRSQLTCNTCQHVYVGQTGRNSKQRYQEHIRYIRNNDPQSAFAQHILNNQHEYGTIKEIMEFPLRLDYGRSPHAYVKQKLQIQLELLMMSGVPLETCWAFNDRWNNKFYYKVASCWLFLLTHGSINIKFQNIIYKTILNSHAQLCVSIQKLHVSV